MDRLINELLDLSRIDRGDPLIIQPQEEDIVAQTTAVITDCRPGIRNGL